MGLISEFKTFINRGNVMDLAVGVIIGGALGEGKKSLALTVRLQPADKTLTDAEIEAISGKIVDKVAKATGGVLRG